MDSAGRAQAQCENEPHASSGEYTYDWETSSIGPIHVARMIAGRGTDCSRELALIYSLIGPIGLLAYLLMRYVFATAWTVEHPLWWMMIAGRCPLWSWRRS